MTRLYIFRHGETFSTKNNDSGYADQQFTAGILPEGREPIEKMANYLKNIQTDYNVASELLRVQQTVKIISKITGKKFAKDFRLNEMLTERGIEPLYPFTGYLEKKLGDLKNFINDMHSYSSILIGSHGFIIAALKHLVITGQFAVENIRDYPKPGVLTIIKDGKIEEIDFN